jgi:hypothetical protein
MTEITPQLVAMVLAEAAFDASCYGRQPGAYDDAACDRIAVMVRHHAQTAARAAADREAAERAAEAAEAAEMTERAARNLAKARADLAAQGVDFAPHPSEAFVTVRRAGSIIGTAMRARVYSDGPAWTFHHTDGREAFTARSEYMVIRELQRLIRQMDASGSANA